ncbi:hypothetical protein [Prevotella sp. AM34-19LB]|uniref:hypothetical protein n=1 Tax=Prevotella sp. AM34-19LB TaxID=2292364 RepID=UPI0013143B7F|nr:hypothetical protein [Prevotella sp. AM34-19LB]
MNVGEHRRVLMRENLAQLDDRIDWIQEECIILYLNSLIGEKGEQISAYQFSKITNIRLSTVTGILNRKVRFRSYQQRRWCCCILYNWDRIVDELIKRHTAEGKKFDKSQFEKNFNEAFSQWITFARDLKQLNKLEAHIAKYQKLFVPKNK